MKNLMIVILSILVLSLNGCGKKDSSDNPPKVGLHIAVAMGDLEAIKQHVKAGTDLNDREWTRGSTPLIMAAAVGETDAAKILIDAGADVNFTNEFGSTPLITAAAFGKSDLAKIFIDSGAHINHLNSEGSTALITASLLCHTEIVQLLLKNGADKTIENKFGRTALKAVTIPMEELKDVYKKVEGMIKIKLDYDRIKTERPKIAEFLK